MIGLKIQYSSSNCSLRACRAVNSLINMTKVIFFTEDYHSFYHLAVVYYFRIWESYLLIFKPDKENFSRDIVHYQRSVKFREILRR